MERHPGVGGDYPARAGSGSGPGGRARLSGRLQQLLASVENNAYICCMQYSVRGIAPEIDAALRNRAQAEGKSLNAVALEVLAEGVGLGEAAVVRRDLSDVAGSWRRDARIEKALADQDEIDEALWR